MSLTGDHIGTARRVTPLHQPPIDDELPSYESVRFDEPPLYTTHPLTGHSVAPPQSPTQTRSSTGLLTRLGSLLRSLRGHAKKPDTELQQAENRITQVQRELALLQEVQDATSRINEMNTTWKLDRETYSPAVMALKLDERTKLGKAIDDNYLTLNSIAKVDFGSEWQLLAAPRIMLLEAKLQRLIQLDKMQQDVPRIQKRIDDFRMVVVCPQYSGMSQSRAVEIFEDLLQDKGALALKISKLKREIVMLDTRLQNMLAEDWD
ncbi:hypothetical protein F4859DRAFT_513036 [Xylaria cf. heliscus]|nr:hypothetical protein F4859DRAFT_513036 [Xylaria cf. heliscus]